MENEKQDPRRDQFAVAAMQGLIAKGETDPKAIAKRSYEMADAILKAKDDQDFWIDRK